MVKYVIKRLLLAIMTTFIILSISFILMKLLPFSVPGGTYDSRYAYMMTQYNLGFVYDLPEATNKYGDLLFKYPNEKPTHYFYQVPVFTQYFAWLRNIFTKWDWGTSTYIAPNVSAIYIIGKRLPTSMVINIISSVIAVPIGIILGIVAALKKDKPTDTTISTLVMIFISIPGFVLITLMMSIFSYGLKWLPTQWPNPTDTKAMKFLGYIIPVFVLSFGSICGYCRFTRAELCEVMESEYLLLARTKGLTKKQSILRHALRNAMVPIVPSILAEFIGVLGGSMILENLYGIPGIGSLYVTAFQAKDYNVLFVDMALFTTISLAAGVFLDISYGFIDPRIRMGAAKQ